MLPNVFVLFLVKIYIFLLLHGPYEIEYLFWSEVKKWTSQSAGINFEREYVMQNKFRNRGLILQQDIILALEQLSLLKAASVTLIKIPSSSFAES